MVLEMQSAKTHYKDPVAQKTSWDPLVHSGSTLKTRKMRVYDDKIVIKGTVRNWIFSSAFLLVGLVAVVTGVRLAFHGEFTALLLLLGGVSMSLFAGLDLLDNHRTTFHKQSGSYYVGRAPRSPEVQRGEPRGSHEPHTVATPTRSPTSAGRPSRGRRPNVTAARRARRGKRERGQAEPLAIAARPWGSRHEGGRLEDIHAIQIIRETVPASSDDSTDFVSLEMNLVFKDGARMNLMDHSDAADIEASARNLGTFLGVPVWRA